MRTRLNRQIWHALLAIAFLSMQSASAHIHLSDRHAHGGHDHVHHQVAHAHNVASHHVDAFDLDSESPGSQVVELIHHWIVKYSKWLDDVDPHAVLVSSFSLYEHSFGEDPFPSERRVHVPSRFFSNAQARAPPA